MVNAIEMSRRRWAQRARLGAREPMIVYRPPLLSLSATE